MHAAVAAMVATLAVRLTRNGTVGYCAGLLFAILPIHVEAVANIMGRAELMCAMGALGALIVLLHRPMTVPRAWAATGCLILAMGGKEQGLLLPILAFLMALCLGIRRPVDERERQGVLWLVVLGCFSTAGFVLYRESILKFGWYRSGLDWVQQPLIRSEGADRILMPLALLGRYAALIVWPKHLSIDYGSTVIGWHVRAGDPYLVIGIAVVIAWTVGDNRTLAARLGSGIILPAGNRRSLSAHRKFYRADRDEFWRAAGVSTDRVSVHRGWNCGRSVASAGECDRGQLASRGRWNPVSRLRPAMERSRGVLSIAIGGGAELGEIAHADRVERPA